MRDGEPKRLHPVKVLDGPRLDAQGNQLVQPRHQLPSPLLTDTKNLRRLGIDRGSEFSSVEAILQDAPDELSP